MAAAADEKAKRIANAAPLRDELLAHLKKEVKQIMEEAVMKRFIYEEGGTVTSLCVAVEACLAHCLRRRAFGLFSTTSTFGLLHKISALCPPAASVVKIVLQIEQKYFKMQKSISFEKRNDFSPATPSSSSSSKSLPGSFRYLWMRIALFEKVLSTIVEYIARNAHKFYDVEALMSDPVSASMVAALLVGPCAVEYSKMKTLDHYWTDPPAGELLQRHRIHSRGTLFTPNAAQSPKSPRPTLQVKRTESLGPDDMSQKLSSSAREYVILLHQNTKSSLLYGKNGVTVWPVGAPQPMKGYLSLHLNLNGSLTIKWTPNDLMHSDSDPAPAAEKSSLWRFALSLDVQDIVYLHCHQQGETGGSIVLVGADGVQHPPIQFPSGQHPLAFLSCLENGMLPWGQLDPPLWLQKGKGKIFPKVKRRSSVTNGKLSDSDEHLQDDKSDYVFRVVPVSHPSRADNVPMLSAQLPMRQPTHGRLVNLSNFSSRFKEKLFSLGSSPVSSPPTTPKSRSSLQPSPDQSPQLPRRNGYHDDSEHQTKQTPELISQKSAPAAMEDSPKSPSRTKLRTACDSMRHQILSRAFYGWLAHCRHLKTIRTHLVWLVNSNVVSPVSPTCASKGLTSELWTELRSSKTAEDEFEFFRRVYFGSMPHGLRRDAWPILLGLYPWNSDDEERAKIYEDLHSKYESSLTDWTSAEAIVKERDREAFKAARGSNESNTSDVLAPKQTSISSDVFFESEDDESLACVPGDAREEGLPSVLTMEALSDVCIGGVQIADQGSDYVPQFGNGAVNEQTSGDASFNGIASRTGRSTPEEGDGGLFSKELVDAFALNLHRIEKDVHRCDRNYAYFTPKNLEKLKNIMCTYVWENLHSGYVQGMCDLAAPLLVVFDDEVLTYGCFSIQMKRMAPNFPHGGGMDIHLANMRAVLQIFDPELFDLMHQNGDYTHFYFSYRWFLLDFKRELLYDDIFRVWETIWAASHVASNSFVLFIATAMIELYRDILLDNNMDFTDVIKFFNEMAEKHDAQALLELARNLVLRLQKAVEK